MIKQYTKKDGSKWWYFKVYLGVNRQTGKKIYTTRRGFKTKKEAKLAMLKLQMDANKGVLPPKKIVFDELYEKWKPIYKTKVRESSYYSQTRRIESFALPYFTGMRIDRISVEYCQEVFDKMALQTKEYKRIKRLIQHIFDLGVRYSWLRKNPLKHIDISRYTSEIPKSDPENFYDRKELLQFFKELKELNNTKPYVMFWVLAYTGLRKGELHALQWKDINFDEKAISVTKTVSEGKNRRLTINPPKTKSGFRTVTVDDDTLHLIREWRNLQKAQTLLDGKPEPNKETYLFTQRDGSILYTDYLNSILKRFYQKSKLKRISVHGFRHTHASLLIAAGATPKEIQNRLGHADITTTMNIYAHLTKEKTEEVPKKLADFMKDGKKEMVKSMVTESDDRKED